MASSFVLPALALAGLAQAHVAAFGPGMYCRNGPDPSNPNLNSNAPVNPLYNLTQDQWWFQHDRGCDKVPPPAGEFLNLPAGGSFDVQLANNQAFTNLSYGGSKVTEWPDGGQHPEDWTGWTGTGEGCIQDSGWIHTQNQTSAQGTAFAIAYESDLNAIMLEDLVVFTVLEHTPWKTAATYPVPAGLPACPEGGCHCVWLWLPRGCGQPNMYMQGFKCQVTGATSTTPLAKAQPPAMCDTDPSTCVQGAKQMIVWNQLTGNNVVTKGSQTPAYNLRNGFKPGAQDDIFQGPPSAPSGTSLSSSASPSMTSSDSISISVVPTAPTQVQVPPGTSSSSSTSASTTDPVSSLSTWPTTLSTVVRPESSHTSASLIIVVPTLPGEQLPPSSSADSTWSTPNATTASPDDGSAATITVTVTATPTHSGYHYKDCWFDGEEVDD